MENEQTDAAWDSRTRLARLNSKARTGRGMGQPPDHEHDWQPYPVDPHSVVVYIMTVYTYSGCRASAGTERVSSDI